MLVVLERAAQPQPLHLVQRNIGEALVRYKREDSKKWAGEKKSEKKEEEEEEKVNEERKKEWMKEEGEEEEKAGKEEDGGDLEADNRRGTGLNCLLRMDVRTLSLIHPPTHKLTHSLIHHNKQH